MKKNILGSEINTSDDSIAGEYGDAAKGQRCLLTGVWEKSRGVYISQMKISPQLPIMVPEMSLLENQGISSVTEAEQKATWYHRMNAGFGIPLICV